MKKFCFSVIFALIFQLLLAGCSSVTADTSYGTKSAVAEVKGAFSIPCAAGIVGDKVKPDISISDNTALAEFQAEENLLTFDDVILNSDTAIIGRYIETIEHDYYIEQKFSVIDCIYGDVPDNEIYLYSNIGTGHISETEYSYELGSDRYVEGVDYILVMEKLQSVMYDHDRYMVDTDILLNESQEEYSMYSEPIELPAGQSMIDYIGSVYASIPRPAAVPTVVSYESEVAEMLGESEFVGVIHILELENEGKVHNGNVYRCTADSLIAGENLNTYDDNTFLLVILKNTVEVGDSYVIGFSPVNENSLIYMQATKASVYEVSEELLLEIDRLQN